jgi:hypothetical protein
MSVCCSAETMPAGDVLLAGRLFRSMEAFHLLEYRRRRFSTHGENNSWCAARVALEKDICAVDSGAACLTNDHDPARENSDSLDSVRPTRQGVCKSKDNFRLRQLARPRPSACLAQIWQRSDVSERRGSRAPLEKGVVGTDLGQIRASGSRTRN